MFAALIGSAVSGTSPGGGNVSSIIIAGQPTAAATIAATTIAATTAAATGGGGIFGGGGSRSGGVEDNEPTNTAGWVAVGVAICVGLCLCVAGWWWCFKKGSTGSRHEYSPYDNVAQGEEAYASGIVHG